MWSLTEKSSKKDILKYSQTLVFLKYSQTMVLESINDVSARRRESVNRERKRIWHFETVT